MIIPLNNNILIRRLETEEETKSGITLQDHDKEKQDKGIVLRTHSKDSQVEVDQTVLFNKYGPVEIEIDGEELLLVNEEELLAIITE